MQRFYEEWKKRDLCKPLRIELEGFVQRGIKITLEGKISTPAIIARACIFQEECNYMRDYVMDEDGNLVEVGFHDVKNK